MLLPCSFSSSLIGSGSSTDTVFSTINSGVATFSMRSDGKGYYSVEMNDSLNSTGGVYVEVLYSDDKIVSSNVLIAN